MGRAVASQDATLAGSVASRTQPHRLVASKTQVLEVGCVSLHYPAFSCVPMRPSASDASDSRVSQRVVQDAKDSLSHIIDLRGTTLSEDCSTLCVI